MKLHHSELAVLILALALAGAFSYDFSKPVKGLGITGLAVGQSCNVQFTSDTGGTCFWLQGPDGRFNTQCIWNPSVPFSYNFTAGVWDMGLESAPSGYRFAYVTPTGSQNCPAGGSIKWAWNFTRNESNSATSNSGTGGGTAARGTTTSRTTTSGCNVQFKSNVYASFRVFKTDGSESYSGQRVNIGGTTVSLPLSAGRWDMRLEENDQDYEFYTVTPSGPQDCSNGGSIFWDWTFVRKSGTGAGNCQVIFTSNAYACFRLFRSGGDSTTQCVNTSGTADGLGTAVGTVRPGEWDMQLQSHDRDYALSSVSPAGKQNCTAGSMIRWDWTFRRNDANRICRDTDGVDYYKEGYVEIIQNGNTVNLYSDYCIIYNTTLVEFYCAGNNALSREYNCPNRCSAGACLVDITVPPPPGYDFSYNLNLKRGWNLVSTPAIGDSPYTEFNSNCRISSGPWHYDPLQNGYLGTAQITYPGYGYWIKSDNDCTMTVNGYQATLANFLDRPPLWVGWNMIGGIPETRPINDIKGTCTFTKGPFWWNPSSNSWETPSNLEPGKGYFVKVDSVCQLNSAENTPPALPGRNSASTGSSGSSSSGTCNNNDREEAGEECDRGDRNGPCPAECSRQCRWNRC